jgi:outer membrane PBP1 activator LpoA protein
MKKTYLLNLLLSILLSGCAHLTDTNSTEPPVLSVPLDNKNAANPSDMDAISSNYPQQVTLLIPLQGPLAEAGQAVRDGFMMAYQNSPSTERPANINIIDSSDLTQIQTSYDAAIQQGAQFIVGPLAKPQVQSIAQTNNTTVPTLVLNYLDGDQAPANMLYQFGLSPLDEAIQVTQLAHQSGKQNAIILVPNGAWGESIANAFQTTWQKQGGNIVATIALSNTQTTLVAQIKQMIAQKRGQYDVILLAAPPATARQITPLLKFYRVNDMPIYATSIVYSGTPNPKQDHDLDGIIFCDAPWTLSQDSATDLKQKLATTYGTNFQNNTRLYGLGVDAYQVMMQFNSLTESSKTLAGATGTLSFNGHRMVRQLTCAQFRNGIPVLLTQ